MNDNAENDFRDKLEDLVFETANGNTGKELDDGLDKVIALVREEEDTDLLVTAAYRKGKYDERQRTVQRCIDAVVAEKFKDNDRCLNAAGYKFNEALDVAIKAIQEAQGD